MRYILALLFSSNLLAGEKYGDTYLDIHGLSYHLNTSYSYNEKNTGGGFTTYLNNRDSISVGSYHNSINNTSNYLSINREYLQTKWTRLILKAGVVTGYRIKVIPSILPVVSLGDKWRVNIGAIPRLKDTSGRSITPSVVFVSFSVLLK